MFRKTKEISEYDRPTQDWEDPDEKVQVAVKNWDPRFKTSYRRPHGEVGFPMGRTTHPDKPNRFKFWWVNQMDGFQPKQAQANLSSMLSIEYSEIRAGLLERNE
jgi:hypothetical protein